jgi:sugar phosphate isomerase/epimerase
VERARRHGVVIALEPCVLDIVPSAKRAADLLTQAASDRIGILLDPANLIAANSEEEMFAHLAPHIACLHGKDRKVNDRMGRALGEGDIDWPAFFRLYHRHTEGKPFILEYVNAGNVCAVRDRVRQADTPQ